MHLKIATYVATIWTNASQAHSTDGLFPENYGWLMKNGKLLAKWYEDPICQQIIFYRMKDLPRKILIRVAFQNLTMELSSLNATTKHGWMTSIETTSKVYLYDEQYIAIVTLML